MHKFKIQSTAIDGKDSIIVVENKKDVWFISHWMARWGHFYIKQPDGYIRFVQFDKPYLRLGCTEGRKVENRPAAGLIKLLQEPGTELMVQIDVFLTRVRSSPLNIGYWDYIKRTRKNRELQPIKWVVVIALDGTAYRYYEKNNIPPEKEKVDIRIRSDDEELEDLVRSILLVTKHYLKPQYKTIPRQKRVEDCPIVEFSFLDKKTINWLFSKLKTIARKLRP